VFWIAVRIFPGFAWFLAAVVFFRGDAELFADAVFEILGSFNERAEIIADAAFFVSVQSFWERSFFLLGGFGRLFLAGEIMSFLADDGAAFGEFKAELVLGAAFAGDLDALGFEFEFFLAV